MQFLFSHNCFLSEICSPIDDKTEKKYRKCVARLTYFIVRLDDSHYRKQRPRSIDTKNPFFSWSTCVKRLAYSSVNDDALQ